MMNRRTTVILILSFLVLGLAGLITFATFSNKVCKAEYQMSLRDYLLIDAEARYGSPDDIDNKSEVKNKEERYKQFGLDIIPEDNMTWVKCSDSKSPFDKPGIPCKKCGKNSVYRAEKCGNPNCGIVFFRDIVPNDFPDRCPECLHSQMEEDRKRRINDR